MTKMVKMIVLTVEFVRVVFEVRLIVISDILIVIIIVIITVMTNIVFVIPLVIATATNIVVKVIMTLAAISLSQSQLCYITILTIVCVVIIAL